MYAVEFYITAMGVVDNLSLACSVALTSMAEEHAARFSRSLNSSHR